MIVCNGKLYLDNKERKVLKLSLSLLKEMNDEDESKGLNLDLITTLLENVVRKIDDNEKFRKSCDIEKSWSG